MIAFITEPTSVASVGDALDNALAETTVGSFKNELIRRQGPWRDVDHVEVETLQWVSAYTGFEDAAGWGVAPDDLVAETYNACQALGSEARGPDLAALLEPSAALPGTENLVVLGPRVMTAWNVDPLDQVDVPAGVTADRAGCPLAVLPHVRWRGSPHAALEFWRGGTERTFMEPVPTPV